MKGIKNKNDGNKSLHGIRRNGIRQNGIPRKGIRRNGKTPRHYMLVQVIPHIMWIKC